MRNQRLLWSLGALGLAVVSLSSCTTPECDTRSDCGRCQYCSYLGTCVSWRDDCASDANCGAGTICVDACCTVGCREDGDCSGASERCQRLSSGGGQCVPACTPDFDLDGKTFEYVYNCTRGYDDEGVPKFCSDHQSRSSVTFARQDVGKDAAVRYTLKAGTGTARETWTGTLCARVMSTHLVTLPSQGSAGYTETGRLAFSDADTFVGETTWAYDVVKGDPSAGGGECTLSGSATGSPASPAAIEPWCL